MRAVVVIFGLVAVSLAGCLTDAPPNPEENEGEQSPTSSLSLEAKFVVNGPAWVISYRAQDEPTEGGYGYTGSLEFSTSTSSGPHSAALFGPIPVRLLGDGTLAPQLDFFRNQIEHSPDGSQIERSSSFFGGGSGMRNPTAGFMFLAASDSDYSFDYELKFPDGVSLDPDASFDLVGNGTSFYYAGGLPGHLVTFKQLIVDLDDSGWSHFQVLTGIGTSGPSVRATDVTFPSERRESHVDWYVPTYGSPPMSYAGVIRDTPGIFYAQSLIAEPRLDLELALLHMPGVADLLGTNWRTGAYHNGSPPVLANHELEGQHTMTFTERGRITTHDNNSVQPTPPAFGLRGG